MSEINLLPTEFRANKDVAKTASILNRLALVAGILFLIAGGIGGAVFYFLNTSVSESNVKQLALRDQITSLESTEQTFILIKDRLQKSQTIMGSRGRFQQFSNYKELVENLPEGSRFTEEELDEATSKLTVITTSSSAIASIIERIQNDPRYTKVKVESLDFDASRGYELIINIF